MGSPEAVKSKAIASLLAQFPGEQKCPLSEKIPRKVTMVELPRRKWTMRFIRPTFIMHA